VKIQPVTQDPATQLSLFVYQYLLFPAIHYMFRSVRDDHKVVSYIKGSIDCIYETTVAKHLLLPFCVQSAKL
jgi:hypothetical protein